MLTFLPFYLWFGFAVAVSQSAWSCCCSGSVWATSRAGLSAPRSSSASSGWFGSMKSAEFQNVCIFGQKFHNCRNKVEVEEAERKTVEPASASLCQNVISTSPTGIWNRNNKPCQNKYWWIRVKCRKDFPPQFSFSPHNRPPVYRPGWWKFWWTRFQRNCSGLPGRSPRVVENLALSCFYWRWQTPPASVAL